MARTLDPAAHALRRDEFVDAAQRLIAAKGYEALSIQDLLDDLGASKGAFYHYFGSKSDLLGAVVDRMVGWRLRRPPADRRRPEPHRPREVRAPLPRAGRLQDGAA